MLSFLPVILASCCLALPSDYNKPSVSDDLQAALGLFPADETENRAVTNSPNQIMDSIVNGALGYIGDLGWDVSKHVQNGYTDIPMDVNTDETSSENFEIIDSEITRLGSLTRSGSAKFEDDQALLSGTVAVRDATLTSTYTVDFAGVGEAPSQKVSGQVSETVNNLFADIEVDLVDLVPQAIKSYTVRSGHDSVDISNLSGNDMKTLHEAGFRKGMRQVLETTMATNIKVQINKAIQDIKNGV